LTAKVDKLTSAKFGSVALTAAEMTEAKVAWVNSPSASASAIAVGGTSSDVTVSGSTSAAANVYCML